MKLKESENEALIQIQEDAQLQEILKNLVSGKTPWTPILFPKVSTHLKMKMNFGYGAF